MTDETTSPADAPAARPAPVYMFPELPRFPLAWALPLIVLAFSIVLTPAAVWWKGRVKDQEWRSAIAAASSAAREVMRKGSEDALATDAEMIKALGDTDAQLAHAQSQIAASVGDGSCPRIPARCLGVR